TPTEIDHLTKVIHPRYRALVVVGAYGGLRIGELAGLRRARVDLLRGAVTVAETVTEVKGRLFIGPPKTGAGRRKGGPPPFALPRPPGPPRGAGKPKQPRLHRARRGTAAGSELPLALLGPSHQGSRHQWFAYPR